MSSVTRAYVYRLLQFLRKTLFVFTKVLDKILSQRMNSYFVYTIKNTLSQFDYFFVPLGMQ